MIVLNPSNPNFLNSEELLKEFKRQASVCHGCRLCFNYCDVFPSMFKLTDSKGVKALTLDDLYNLAEYCFHCNMCYVNCPYVAPHEFNMDFPRVMEWALGQYKSKKGLTVQEALSERTDSLAKLKKAGTLATKLYNLTKPLLGINGPAPDLVPLSFHKEAKKKIKDIKNPKAKVVLFHTCLVENFNPEIGLDLIDVYQHLGIEVKLEENFRCCGAPMLDVGDFKKLKENAEHNLKLLEKYVKEGYDIVSPIPTCTLMLTKEYKLLLEKEDIPKVYDSLEYLNKLKREGKIELNTKLERTVKYHPPCHLKYLGVGYNGVQLMRSIGCKVNIVNKGCSGIDGGWGLRHYDVAKRVGEKMMEEFKQGKEDYFVTECPLAGIQIKVASGKQALHPIQVLKEGLGL